MISTSRSIKIPQLFWVLWFAALVLGLLSANPLQTVASLLALPILITLLWRKDELPILFFALLMQWLAITIKVFAADIEGTTFSNPLLHSQPAQIERAFFLSLIACLVLSLGINRATRNIRPHSGFDEILPCYDVRKCLGYYIIFSLSINSIIVISRFWPSLAQAIIHFSNLKWGFLILVLLLAFKKYQYRALLILVICFELLISLAAYFSVFKSYLIFALIVILSLGIKWSWKRLCILLIIAAVSLDLVLIWTFVKPQYRPYLSGGEKAQIVTVTRSDALKKVIELASAMDADDYSAAANQLIDRISYIDFFSACLNYVPRILPYQNGTQIKTAIMHIMAPRMFFPDKAAIDDSVELNFLTGLSVATAKEGVSISLGYIGQCYVDFGPILMFIPIFVLGILIGSIYKILMNQSLNLFWGYCVTAPMYFSCSLVEISLRKLIGALIMYLIVALITIKTVAPWIDGKMRTGTRTTGRG